MSNEKNILILGAKSDIAVSAAHKFASKGYNLQLASRNSQELALVSEELSIKYDISVSIYELDIVNFKTFQSFVRSLKVMPHIVLCAVGILGKQIDDQKIIEDSLLIMQTNYLGPSLLLGEFANHFEKRGFGSIIGISSVAGERGRASNYIYGSSKSGFTAYLSGLRARLDKSNVSVLSIIPGFVNTKMTNHLNFPKILTSSTKYISNIIYSNRMRSKEIIIFPWNIIMAVIKLIPTFIFKKMKL